MPIKLRHSWVYAFGWLNLLIALATTATAMLIPETILAQQEGLSFTLGLLVAVSLSLIYTGQQLRMGSDIGHKAYPASLVAYGLFILMAVKWFTH